MDHVYSCDWPVGPGCTCPRDPVTGALVLDEAPAATSLAAGAIARSVDDAYTAYRARLARAVADLREASVQD
jgi:hypothetical protein